MDIRETKAAVLHKIRPSREEEDKVKRFADNLLRLAKVVSGMEAKVCGSIGKFTWLRGDHDIDLFILFPKSASRESLEKQGLAFGKKIVAELKGDYVIKYAEHPYVHGSAGGFDIDIVPCYKIRRGEKIISAVDRSPLHLQFIIDKLDPGLRDEVRLLKQFCKGIGVYGSDTKTQGFSGYIGELLVIHYGTFEDVLERAAKWTAPKMLGSESKKTKFDAPLVVLDPTDSTRNAAANVSAENFVRFVVNSRRFLEKPGESFFWEQPAPLSRQELKKLKDRKTKFLALRFRRPDVIDDVLFPQLRRALHRLGGLAEYNEFIALRSCEYADRDAVLVFEFEVWALPDVKKMVGPPISSQAHAKEFLSKYNDAPFGPAVEDNRWFAEKQRECKDVTSLFNSFLSQELDKLKESGIPEGIAQECAKATIIEHDEFWEYVEKNDAFSAFMRKKYFEKLV